jgi:hypothetical protein
MATPQVTQNDITVVFNFASQSLQTSQSDVHVISKSGNVPVQVSQLDYDVVYRGKTFDPTLRAWNFTLDSHEFYVLRLGDNKTLIYDLSTDQWSWWATDTLQYWRPNTGTNWSASGSIPFTYGSNVITGDSNFGILWVVNPEQGYDDVTTPEGRLAGQIAKFPRVATGQMLSRGRMTLSCYQTYLVTEGGRPAYENASVTLSYSDDNGNSFVNASEPVIVQPGDYTQEIVWRSLGLIKSPGRIFRVQDDGAISKITELTVYDNSAPQ